MTFALDKNVRELASYTGAKYKEVLDKLIALDEFSARLSQIEGEGLASKLSTLADKVSAMEEAGLIAKVSDLESRIITLETKVPDPSPETSIWLIGPDTEISPTTQFRGAA